MESFYAYAHEYLTRKRSIIPLYPREKRPYCTLLPHNEDGNHVWSPYTKALPTQQEIAAWSSRSGDQANIGQVMGAVSGVFGLDIDFRNGGEDTWRELSGGRDIITETSVTGDGLHLFFKYPNYRFQLKETLRGIDLRSDNGYLVAPPSVHPSGRVYEAKYIGQVLETPSFLTELLKPFAYNLSMNSDAKKLCGADQHGLSTSDNDTSEVDTSVTDSSRIHAFGVDSQVAEALRVFRTCEARRVNYQSRSEYDYAVLVKLLNRNFDLDTVRLAFAAARQHSTHYQRVLKEEGLKRANAYINRMWERASKQPSLVTSKEEISAYADELRQTVESQVWKRVKDKSAKAVLLAHIEFCISANRKNEGSDYVWNASLRDLAEKARLGIKTVWAANGRLIEDGWLMHPFRFPRFSGNADEYRFGVRCQKGNIHNHRERGIQCVPFQPRSNTYGVFENKWGMGKTAEAIWWALIDGCTTVAAVETKTGTRSRTIQKHIEKMQSYSMVKIIGGQIQPLREFDFKQLSQSWDIERVVLRRIENHNIHRDSFASGIKFRKQLEATPAEGAESRGASQANNTGQSIFYPDVTHDG